MFHLFLRFRGTTLPGAPRSILVMRLLYPPNGPREPEASPLPPANCSSTHPTALWSTRVHRPVRPGIVAFLLAEPWLLRPRCSHNIEQPSAHVILWANNRSAPVVAGSSWASFAFLI